MKRATKTHSVAHLKKAFLEQFARLGNVAAAAQATGVGRRTVYDWRAGDETFKSAFEDASTEATEWLEEEARRRAVDGTVNRFGEREYSDTLLIFLLKARDPRKYADRREISGPDGGPLQVSDADLDQKVLTFLDKVAERTAPVS